MNGVLIIDKPKDFTSHDIVNIARKALKTKRVGHIGTLDPNATGVLVLCVNKATKLVKYFENHRKTYTATIRLGVKTDTDDITGKIVEKGDTSNLTDDKIKEALNSFLGEQKQIPPNYSAIKVNGKKLYELARRDIVVPNIKPRDIEIFKISNFKLLERNDDILFKVDIDVSKGTYIRSIARDLGDMLGCCGTLQDLRRTSIEQFNIKEAITVEDLKAGHFEIKEPFQFLNLQKITLSPMYKFYIQNGRFLDLNLFPIKTDTIIYSTDGEVLAIYYYDEQKDRMRMSVKWC